MRLATIVLGLLSALLILSQLVLGQLILSGRATLVKSHQHTGYLTVVVVLAYIGLSLSVLLSAPRKAND
jgi:hypothetical protein